MFEFHHMDKWGYANLDLIEESLEKNDKTVVVISGASSSGKSFAAAFLATLLDKNNHRALIISLDQYNFGLSGIIPNKVNINYFGGKIKNLEEIENRIKKIIYHVPFDSKYSRPVLDKIREQIKDLLPKDDLEKFLDALYEEWKKLNFDEPTVYNLKEAAKDVKDLLQNQSIKVKEYSKVVSERLNTRKMIYGKDYDVIIVEGIYGLDKSFLDSLKDVDCIKDFIDGNPKSLFLRRIIRDAKTTSANNVFTISLYFKYIVPSYIKTILPGRKKADVVLNNDMTFSELRAGSLYITKDEVHTDSAKLIDYLNRYGKKEGETSFRKDIYLVAPNENVSINNILRIREISDDEGKTYHPTSLVNKGTPKVRKDDKIIRPINVLLNEEQFPLVWKNESDCLNDFLRSGFLVGSVEKKEKTHIYYLGQKLTILNTEDQGYTIEFGRPYKKDIVDRIKNKARRYQEEEIDE
ncbi:MAG: hypothetical protein WCS80_04240 [Bacilli bacterium]